MTAKLFIRISAIFVLIHLIGHTMGHLSWDDETGPHFGVVKQMMSHQAEFMGAVKSMGDYYNGYSLIMFGVYGMTIAVLWTLSSNIEGNQNLIKKLLYPIGLAYLFFSSVEFIYFFPFAGMISLLAGLSALFSTLKLTNNQNQQWQL